MFFEEAKCLDCNFIYVITKNKIMDEWVSGICPNCKSKNTKRIYSSFNFNVCAGNCGNSSTGYQTEIVYKPSTCGKFKGIDITKIGQFNIVSL